MIPWSVKMKLWIVLHLETYLNFYRYENVSSVNYHLLSKREQMS